MPSSKSVWLCVIALVVIVAGVYLLKPQSVLAPVEETAVATPTNPNLPIVTITMDDNGFSPNEVIIKAGQKVEWINKSSRDFWPASNIHPTHSLYPDSSIFKCLTPDEPTIFDSCRPVTSGKSYSFTFGYKGEWRYHDHLRANKTGIIRV